MRTFAPRLCSSSGEPRRAGAGALSRARRPPRRGERRRGRARRRGIFCMPLIVRFPGPSPESAPWSCRAVARAEPRACPAPGPRQGLGPGRRGAQGTGPGGMSLAVRGSGRSGAAGSGQRYGWVRGSAAAARTKDTSLREGRPHPVLRAAHALRDPGCCRCDAESLPREAPRARRVVVARPRSRQSPSATGSRASGRVDVARVDEDAGLGGR